MKPSIDFLCVIYNHSINQMQKILENIHDKMQYCPYFDYKFHFIINDDRTTWPGITIEDGINFIYSDKNLGYCGGNNLGIKETNGDYIIIINPDIIIKDSLVIDWLIGNAKLYNGLVGRLIGKEWITYSSCFHIDKKYENIDELPFYFDQRPDFSKPIKSATYLDGSLFCFPRSLNIKFDENIFPGYFAEIDLAFDCFLKGIPIIHENIKNLILHNSNHSKEKYEQIKKWSKEGRDYFYLNKALPNYDKFLKYLNK